MNLKERYLLMEKLKAKLKKQGGFTMVELLIVVA
ncbi:MAG: type II secretion system protein, partial [Oscillibacter sp.]|nr:type II secretion system protein [Oscillibacter sp.]